MALQVVTIVEPGMQLLEEPDRTGDTVTEVRRRRGISRRMFRDPAELNARGVAKAL